MNGFAAELSTAVTAVRTAARVCQAVQKQITPESLEKRDKSPVTIADYASQAVVCRALRAAFPQDPVVGEEDAAELKQPENASFLGRIQEELGRIGLNAEPDAICGWIDHGCGESAARFWTLDPIDGTKGFLRGEQYAISLALIIDGAVTVAALGCPNLPLDESNPSSPGTLLFAVRGAGAWMTSIEGDGFDPAAATRIQVSPATDFAQSRFVESVESGHSAHSVSAQIADALQITREPVRMDSQAKYAAVARGDAEAYLRLPTRADYREKIWDHAGGVLVVQEAGGTVTDVAGLALDFTLGSELAANRGVIVTNGPLQSRVLEAVAAAGVK